MSARIICEHHVPWNVREAFELVVLVLKVNDFSIGLKLLQSLVSIRRNFYNILAFEMLAGQNFQSLELVLHFVLKVAQLLHIEFGWLHRFGS